MRILAVDHGQKRIGLAVSDETGTLARPLLVLKHIARAIDAAAVSAHAQEQGAAQIIVGASYNEEGELNPAGQSAARFAEALRLQTELPVLLWDESLTTQDARLVRLTTGAGRRKRSGHLDDVAAAVLLQNYLDTHSNI